MRSPTLSELPRPPGGKTGWPWTEERQQQPDAMPDGCSWPQVTVVTPSYNQGQFIEETIRSVLLQGYPNLEYIIIDGGSTDGSVEIIKKYDKYLACWVSEPDRGQSAGINKGWREGHGEILAWLNSDDTYLLGAVHMAVSYLSRTPEVSAVYAEGYHTEKDGRIRGRYPTEPFNLDRLKDTCFICQPTVFIRRAIVDQAGYLDESLEYCMDYDLWIRIAKVSRFGYVPEYWAATRFYTDTKTLARRREVYAEVLRTVHRHFGCVPLSWVYAYARAVAEADNRRETAWDEGRFVVRLFGVGLVTLLRYNRRVPISELVRWTGSLGRAWQVVKRGAR